jgi:precorrin-8X/cobalt-precorrin-8 methylmutase
VGAAESKEELVTVASEYGIPFITNRGRKGGSNVAAAVMNALLIMALEQKVL